MGEKKIVFVGMSGGVDSSVAAHLLKEAGHTVVGVFIKVWQPPFLHCHWEDERLDAMRAAAALEIPFLTCDAEEAYRREVADYFIREYKEGNTPNPDVMCNRYVKFGAFHTFAKAHGATNIATGHYARRVGESLLRGIDPKKDQSYFLWNAPKAALQDTIFPLGELTKEEVRHIAKRAGLPNAEKRDSQGICFLGDVDIPEFLGHYLTLTAGDVLDEAGKVIGTHEGALLYTLGQRHGFTIESGTQLNVPLFVVARDLEKNTVTVGAHKLICAEKNTTINLKDVQFFTSVAAGERYHVQLRYHGPLLQAQIEHVDNNSVSLSLEAGADIPMPGQSAVLYEKDTVILGGIITS